MEKYYIGTELKLAFTIECEGFDMTKDHWTAKVICGGNSIICDKTQNAFMDDNNQWFILVDTALLGSGFYNVVVDIDVPDNDFDDGFRHEVIKKELFVIKRV